MSSPDVLIKDYYLSLRPRLRVPVSSLLCASAAGCGYPKPASWFSGSRGAAPPSPPAHRWLNARRPAADSSPPDRRWIKPAGSPLTHARRSPLTLAPWIQSTCHGQESRVCVLLCPQEHFNQVLSCLVCGDSSGAGVSSRLPPCRRSGSGCWGTLWGPLTPRHAQRKPLLPSSPRRASCSCGMSCPVCLAPEGSWYPLTSPGKFFWG